jgi:predicted nucleic acid-binding protein
LIIKAITPASFTRKLGHGETDAISLAMELNGILIIDDKKGRNEAKDQGVDAISTRAMPKIAEEKKIIRDFLEMEEALKQRRFFVPPYE